MEPKDFFLPFIKKEQVAKDTYAFFFDRVKRDSADQGFDFLPGQFIRMTIPMEHPDERGTSRNFSITTSPTNTKILRTVTRVIQSTFKKSLLTLQPSQLIQFFGPAGQFYLRENEPLHHILLAGGIGITPFLSMLNYINDKKLTIPVTMFVSFSTPEEVILQEETYAIALKNPSVKVVYTVSHSESLVQQWNGETGRISEDLIKKYVKDISQSLFYLVGPPKMVSAMEGVVLRMGISAGRILRERFVGY